jgi:integral membrane protein
VRPAVLTAYRILAYVTAVLLLVLCVGVVLRYAYLVLPAWPEGSATQLLGKQLTQTVGVLHGNLYIVYLFVALVATVQLKVPMGRMLLVLLAGTIPFGAFFAERKVTYWNHLRRQGMPLPGETRTDPAADTQERSTSS